jgi:2-hydroxy-3-keto-5-methylthiopentenyl-1-phosphate phosphatase
VPSLQTAAKLNNVARSPFVLITDFDGTISRTDFFELAVDRFVRDNARTHWHYYTSGRITHFEAMRRIYAQIRCDEETLRATVRDMNVDPRFADCVAELRVGGWDVIVVSAGCDWYIDQVLRETGAVVNLVTNPSRFEPNTGLIMEPPVESPFFSPTHGIDKRGVVQDALERYRRVAFAGNGKPDLDAALLAPAETRFACGWLADEFERRTVPFRRFNSWCEVADSLLRNGSGGA